ncbi:hypothetical protein [Mycobacterium deserti]|uniref:Uncharacterized protein n=1 Tax=Mycobacterium deserti TaxID=2978347 RepID=A0ABT2MGS5_9MYCO|nr:hypothetical protein [Mycobacterium deserti]MCT7661491.1 hypothetical protein [Mycobacterium deserti]
MAPDEFDNNSPLTPAEQLDSDEVRNDDGDEVVDPPERWIPPKQDETLDERLSDEVPDVTAEEIDPSDADDDQSDIEVVSDDELDQLDMAAGGKTQGQVSGTPEDGESFFDVVE